MHARLVHPPGGRHPTAAGAKHPVVAHLRGNANSVKAHPFPVLILRFQPIPTPNQYYPTRNNTRYTCFVVWSVREKKKLHQVPLLKYQNKGQQQWHRHLLCWSGSSSHPSVQSRSAEAESTAFLLKEPRLDTSDKLDLYVTCVTKHIDNECLIPI